MRASKPKQQVHTYQYCMKFIRDCRVVDEFNRIVKAETIPSREEYNFVLYYTIARIVFSNGARCEYGYKAKRKHLAKTTYKNKKYTLLKLPDAKAGKTLAVLSKEDHKFLRNQQRLQRKLISSRGAEESELLFLNYDLGLLDNHISQPITRIMVSDFIFYKNKF